MLLTVKHSGIFCICFSSYDHLTRLLIKVIDERPHNVVDLIEDMSHDVKRGSFDDKHSNLPDFPQTTSAELLTEQQSLLFYRPDEADQDEEQVLAVLKMNICLDSSRKKHVWILAYQCEWTEICV